MTMPFLPTRKLRARKFPAARCTAIFAAITALFFVVALGNSANAQSTNYWRNVAGNGLWANDDGSGINNWFRASDGWDVRRGDLSNGQWSATSTPKSYNILIFDNGTQATTTVNAIGGAKYHVAEIRLANSTDRTFNSSDGGYLAMSNASGVAKIESVSGGTGTYTFNVPILFEENTEINAVNGNLVFGSSSTITNNSFTLISYTSSGRTAAFNGVISGSGGLEHKGDGLVTLGAVNTYTGATTVEGAGGAIQIENASALGGTAAGTTVSSGAALNVFNVSGTINEGLTLNGTGVSSGGALRNISGNNTWGGGITLASASRINSDSGTLTIDPTSGNAISGSFNITLGGAGNININDPIATGSGTLTKDGTGQVNLAGVNTYTGTTTVSAGSLEAQSASALGTTANGTTVSSGAALRLWNATGVTFDAEALSLVGTGVGDIGALYNAGGANTWQGNITLTGGTRIGAVTSSSLTLSGTIDLATANTLYIGGAGNFTIGNNFLNAGKTTADGAIFWDGTGTLRLNQATQSALTGNINLRSGTVLLGAANALGSGAITASANSTLTIASADTTARSIGNNVTLAGNLNLGQAATGTGAVTLGGTLSLGATRTITVNNNLATISGAISGASFGLTKAGTGTLVLSSASSSYSGATTVNAGTLEFNGSNTSTTTTVANGGALAGTGTLAGVTVQGGGRIGAGASGGIGNLSVSALTLEASGGYNWELGNVTGTAGTNWDLITVGAGGGGTINASAVTSVNPFTIFITGNPTGWNPATSGSWTIMNGGGSITGFAANKFTVNTTGFGGSLTTGTWAFADNSGELVLSYNAPITDINVVVNTGAVDQGAGAGITGGATQFSGSGTLIKSGAGTLIMTNGGNNYTGGTTIAEGAISINVAAPSGSAGALGNSTAAVNIGTSGAAVAAGFDFGAAVENQRILEIVAGNGAGGTRAITTSFGSGTATQVGGVTVGTNTAVTVASGSTLLISGALSGSGALNINGTGVTVLSTNSTGFSGTITNQSGSTLRVGHNNGLGTGGLILNGGTLSSDSSTARAITNAITLNANVALGDATGTGNLSVSNVNLNGATRTLTVSNNSTIAGAISGSAGNGLTKAGDGTLTLSGNNSFDGAVTINAGRLNVGGSSAIGNNAAVSVASGATFGLNALEEIGSLTGAGNVALGGLLIAGGNGTSTTYSGSMSGSDGFVKKGAGTMTFSGANSYGGQTFIVGGAALYSVTQGGGFTNMINLGETNGTDSASLLLGAVLTNPLTVRFGSSNNTLAVASSSSSAITYGGNVNLFNNNFTIGQTTGGTGSVTFGASTNTFFLGDDGGAVTRLVTVNGSHTIAAQLTGGANNRIAITGGGTLTLSGANTFSGGSQINNGTLLVGNNAALGTGALTFDFAGGTGSRTLASSSSTGYTLNNDFNLFFNALTIGQTAGGTGSLVLGGTGKAFFLGSDDSPQSRLVTVNGSHTIAANLTGGANNNFVKQGLGTLTLSGSNNTFAGGLFIDSGVVNLSGGALSGGNVLDIGAGVNGGTTNGNDATLRISAASTYGRNITVNAETNTSAVSGNRIIEFAQASGSATLSGTIGLEKTVIANVTNANTTGVLSGNISGAGGLTKSGSGSLVLSGSNNFAGNVTISSGTIALTNGNAIGNDPLVTIDSGATLAVLSTETLGRFTGSGAVNIANGQTLTNSFSGNSSTFSGQISGAGGLTKAGTGTVTLSGSNSFSGLMQFDEGVLLVGNANALGAGTVQVQFDVGGTRTIASSSASGFTVANNVNIYNSVTLGQTSGGTGSLTFSGNIDLGNPTATNNRNITVNGNHTFSGVMSGSNSLTKLGSGTLTLSGAGANTTFTGGAIVSAGTLQLNKSTDVAAINGPITVGSTATLLLSSSGNVANTAAVTLSGGTIQRGAGVSEAFGNLNVTAASFLDFGTGAVASGYGMRFENYTASALLTVNNFLPGNKLQFASGFNSALLPTGGNLSNANFAFSTGFTTGTENGYFTITAIPEPSTYLAAAGLLAMFLWPVRRRLVKDARSILGLRPSGRDRMEGYRNA